MMRKILAALVRPLRNFNIENRTEKVISQEKPTVAPQYKYVEQQKEIATKVNPDFLKEHYRKDAQLDQRLKDVFITSTDPQVTETTPDDSKPLPRYTFEREEPTYNYYEPAVIPVGRCSVKQAVTLLAQHKQDPVKYSIENIAAEYKLDKKIVGDIVKYFHLYAVKPIEPPNDYSILEDRFQQEIDDNQKMVKAKKELEEKAKKELEEKKKIADETK